MRILIASPHRDDAAFSLSLAVETWLGLGHSITVVNVFTHSSYAPIGHVPHLKPESDWSRITALRKAEDDAWKDLSMESISAIGDESKGAKRGLLPSARLDFVDLALWDAPLRLKCSEDLVCGTPVVVGDESMTIISRAMRELDGDVWMIPLGIGGHVDHLTVRDALLSGVPLDQQILFYEDLPYAARPGAACAIDDLARKIDGNLVPGFASDVTDSSKARGFKFNAAMCYPSQIDTPVANAIAEFCLRYGGRERMWSQRRGGGRGLLQFS